MSVTLLYHMHGIRGDTFVKQKLVPEGIEFYIEVPRVHLCCPCCGSQNVWQKGCQTRKFYSLPFEKKRQRSSWMFQEFIVLIAKQPNKLMGTSKK